MLHDDSDAGDVAVFESAAVTLTSLFLQDSATARRRFTCSVFAAMRRRERMANGQLRYASEHVGSELARFLLSFAPDADAVADELRAWCPRRPRLASAALRAARGCARVADELARLLMDAWMSGVHVTDVYNPATTQRNGVLRALGVSPGSLLYVRALFLSGSTDTRRRRRRRTCRPRRSTARW